MALSNSREAKMVPPLTSIRKNSLKIHLRVSTRRTPLMAKCTLRRVSDHSWTQLYVGDRMAEKIERLCPSSREPIHWGLGLHNSDSD